MNLRPRVFSDHRRRGSVSILTAISILVLVGVVGIGLDTALVLTARQQLQRTADAAALSGAAKFLVPGQTDYDLVRQAAIETARANTVIRLGPVELADNPSNTPSSSTVRQDIVVGKWGFDRTDRTFKFVPTDFVTGLPRPDSIQIYPRCGDGSRNNALSLIFSPIFNSLLGTPNESNVGAPATAKLGWPDQPLILVLDRHARNALQINGGAYMDVLAGTIQVDSDDACAFSVNGTSGRLEAQRARVVGGVCLADQASNLVGDLITGSPYVPDPLAALPAPSSAAMPNLGGITTAGTYAPGYYPDGINLSGGDLVNLLPGIYYIGKNAPARGLDLSGSAFLTGSGVMLYLEAGASVSINGAGAGMRLSPPLSGTYAGVTVFQSRTGRSDSDIGGGGEFDVRGTYYVPNGQMTMRGDVTRKIGRILVNTLLISGNPRFVITGDDVPPPDGPPTTFLVK